MNWPLAVGWAAVYGTSKDALYFSPARNGYLIEQYPDADLYEMAMITI